MVPCSNQPSATIVEITVEIIVKVAKIVVSVEAIEVIVVKTEVIIVETVKAIEVIAVEPGKSSSSSTSVYVDSIRVD